MMKKLLCGLMAGILAVSMMSACGSSTPSAPAAPTAPAAPAGDSAPAAPAESSGPEYSEITVEIFDRGTDGGKTDPTNNYYTNWIKEKVLADENIGVTFVAVSRWEETDQLNNLMASGSAPDVCLTYSNELIANYRDLGGLVDLTPYIESPILADLKAFLGEDSAVPGKDLISRSKLNDSGATYSIPARRMNVAQMGTFIRKDWLDKLSLPVPSTTQEFYEALKAFKEKDPGGIGSNKVVAFTMTSDVRWRARTLLESFIDPSLSDKDRWVNTVIDRQLLLPGYKEGVRFLNKMYNEGLVDPEFPLYIEDTESDNLIKSGVVGAFIHNWDQAYRDTPGIYKELAENVPGAEYISIDPFKDATGKTSKASYDPAGVNYFVPVYSKNVDGALRYINWLSKFENRSFLQIGNEGVTHEIVDGVPKMIPAEGPEIMNSAQNIDYTIIINGLDLGSPDLNAKALTYSYNVDAATIVEAYDNALRNAKPLLVVPGVTLSAAGPVTQTLIDKEKTVFAETITASEAGFDAAWDAAIGDWLASGAQAVIEERAAKYDEYIASQG